MEVLMYIDPVFYLCSKCGTLYTSLNEGKSECCSEELTRLEANKVDAAKEKHVPVVNTEGSVVTVKIGSVPHPMTEEHYIEWIFLVTENGYQYVRLQPGDEPVARFFIGPRDTVKNAYEFCNLHGLWMS